MKKEAGFYWIKVHKEWTIAELDSDDYWNLAGSDVTIKAGDALIEDVIMPRIGWQPELISLTLKCPVCNSEGHPHNFRKDKPVHFICNFKNDKDETCGTIIIVQPKGAEKPIVL